MYNEENILERIARILQYGRLHRHYRRIVWNNMEQPRDRDMQREDSEQVRSNGQDACGCGGQAQLLPKRRDCGAKAKPRRALVVNGGERLARIHVVAQREALRREH